MSRTTKFRASLWLAIPLVAVAGELAMAANHAPVSECFQEPRARTGKPERGRTLPARWARWYRPSLISLFPLDK